MTEAALTGHSIIAGTRVPGNGASISAVDPRTGETFGPEYSLLVTEQLKSATEAAARAARTYRETDPEARAAFLDLIASKLEDLRLQITARLQAETGLPEARANGELSRTTGQLRMFAQVVRDGVFHGVRLDAGDQDRTPLPKPDLRQRRIALGPVAVFGASNFPLAFSVAGGDTASALAAGCPVIVKAHNAHPGLSEIVGSAITEAVAECGLDAGVFSLIYGPGAQIGQALVADPVVKAVGFTGSRGAGTALMEVAAARQVPIPVYAEMSAINPVIVLPGALSSEGLASAFVTSLMGSSGQLCTAPGVVFVPRSEAGDSFVTEVKELISAQPGQTMLTPSIAKALKDGVDRVGGSNNVELLSAGVEGPNENAPRPMVFETSAETFATNEQVREEIFGAASLIVRFGTLDDLEASLEKMEGQLTATFQLTEADAAGAARLLPLLEEKAGRILVNGWPTGVEVGNAVIHGGPYPATSDSRSTSVGSAAIDRFLRPVAYQDFPEFLQPAPVRDNNPWNLKLRLIEGQPRLS